MNETTHTPGPWHVGGLAQRTPIVYDARGYAVADATTFHYKYKHAEGAAEANARLIAAAPDLLAALRVLTEACNQPELDPLVMFASVEKACAAIAKAERK